MRNSLLFLSPEVWFDDQTVHCQVDHQWPHGGVEDSTGEQLVRQVDREEVGLTGPVQPAGNTRTHTGCVRSHGAAVGLSHCTPAPKLS